MSQQKRQREKNNWSTIKTIEDVSTFALFLSWLSFSLFPSLLTFLLSLSLSLSLTFLLSLSDFLSLSLSHSFQQFSTLAPSSATQQHLSDFLQKNAKWPLTSHPLMRKNAFLWGKKFSTLEVFIFQSYWHKTSNWCRWLSWPQRLKSRYYFVRQISLS